MKLFKIITFIILLKLKNIIFFRYKTNIKTNNNFEKINFKLLKI